MIHERESELLHPVQLPQIFFAHLRASCPEDSLAPRVPKHVVLLGKRVPCPQQDDVLWSSLPLLRGRPEKAPHRQRK